MSRRWIRLDVEWDTSGWLVELEPAAQLAWVKLLCWVKVHGKGGRSKALAFAGAAKKWDVPRESVGAMIEAARADGALQVTDGEWIVTAWATYQEPDLKATERKRRQRARENVTDVTPGHAVTLSRDHRPLTETTPPGGGVSSAHAREESQSAEGREPRRDLDPSDPWAGLEPVVVASIRGLYGGPGREGTDAAVWREANGMDRERALATALLRWRAEGHDRFHAKLFRRILADVIAEQAHAPEPGGERLWA